MFTPRIAAWISLAMLAGVLVTHMPQLCAEAISPRWQNATRRAMDNPHQLYTVAATFFGTESHEEFVHATGLPDGSVIAIGNAWGPTFPHEDRVRVLGSGRFHPMSEFPDGQAMIANRRGQLVPAPLSYHYPNISGFIVRYGEELQSIKELVRFDWGVANIRAAYVLPDGDIIIAGNATDAFASALGDAPVQRLEVPSPNTANLDEISDPAQRAAAEERRAVEIRRRYGPIYWDENSFSGDTYVARLSSDLRTFKWAWIMEAHRNVETNRMWHIEGDGGWMVFESNGIKRVRLDGSELDDDYGLGRVGRPGHGINFLGVDPRNGNFFRGGDRHSNTGREPWRQPRLVAYDNQNQENYQLYGWPAALVGHDRSRLVSDTGARHVAVDDDGWMWIALWSDGGNSVGTVNPVDLERRPNRRNVLGLDIWGASVMSVSHIVRYHPDTYEMDMHAFWIGHLPRTGTPSSVNVSAMWAMDDGSLALTGGAATGLIQTADAWKDFPEEIWDQQRLNQPNAPNTGYGGPYVALVDPHNGAIGFSSYAPGMNIQHLGRVSGTGMLVASWAVADDGRDQATPTPTHRALQAEFAGGRRDGHLVLLLPKENP